MDRLYVNAEDILDFDFSTYRTGNISGATLDGEKISNSRATALRAAKTYVDVATGRLYSGHHLIETAAKAIIESVMDEIRAEEEAAEAAETDETIEEEKIMFDNYEITMDSFGSECPENWEEIASFLNDLIDTKADELTTTDDWGIQSVDEDELKLFVDGLWETYCAGELDGAPAPIF